MVKHEPADVRHQQFFEAALQICAEKGYHAARVDDIVERAGLSKGAMYHHFSGKKDLFIQLFTAMTEEMKAHSVEALNSMTSAADAFRHVNEVYTLMVKQSPWMVRGMLDFFMSNYRDEEVRAMFFKFYTELCEPMAQLIQRGIDQGEFSSDLDPHEIAWGYFTAGDGMLFLHFFFHLEEKGTERMMTLIDLLIRGMRAAPATPDQEVTP